MLELGAVLRGANGSPVPTTFVFGLDRGGGPALGPRFPERPGITPDALVTITAGPHNTAVSGTITDLEKGAVATIEPSQIRFAGSTLRVFVHTAQLPSTGRPIAQYRFAFWTQSHPGRDFGTVGSILPDSTMIPIGVSRTGPAR
jgi:hypothetical protein